jgi:hypothetical protein
MVAEKLAVPGLDEDETVTLNLLVQQLADRARRNRERSNYYDGKRAIKMVGNVIPPQYRTLALALGWSAKGVDGLTRRCNLEQMIWSDGKLSDLGMRELQDANFMLSEIAQAEVDSALHGVSFLITTRGVDRDEPKALIHARDALSATGVWNNRRRRLDNLLSVTEWTDRKVSGFNLYLDGLTITAEKVDGVWEVEKSEHPWHVPAEPMVYRPRSSKRLGRSRITRAAMSHQDAALRALVRLEGHMDIYSIPQLMILGASDAMFKNPDGSFKSAFQVVLGRVFGIPDDEDATTPRADVKQFSAASPEPHLADLNALAKLVAREFDLPDSDFALTDLANPTSEGSYIAGRDNLVAEAEGAMDDWSISIRRTVTRALAIQNGLDEVPKQWASIDTEWRSPLYLSRSAAADAGAKIIGAVPWLAETTVGLKRLGLSQQEIDNAQSERLRARGRSVVDALRAPSDAVAS